jgi:hypothetical protein
MIGSFDPKTKRGHRALPPAAFYVVNICILKTAVGIGGVWRSADSRIYGLVPRIVLYLVIAR